jgi:acetyl esterase/lipase
MKNTLRHSQVAAILFALILASFTFRQAVAEGYEVERNHVYAMHSGLALVMDVYKPSKPNGYGIVFISGSGWTRELSQDAQMLTATGQELIYAVPLAEAGYTVFNLNHRAAPRFRYPAPVEDVQRAVRYIRHNAESFGIDPDTIGGMGGSSGAHLISLLATMDSEGNPNDPSLVNRESARLQAVVTRAAPLDLRDNPVAPLFGFRARAAKPGSVEAQQLVEASPITYVTSDDAPFLLVHGDADTVVPFEWSERMYEALKKAGVPATLMPVHGGGHGPNYEYTVEIDGKMVRKIPENAPDYIGAMIDWFDKYIHDK